MKKYLMSGIAAIAVCAAFTSCSKENLYDENQINQNAIAKAQQDYATAFIATFGQPAANQDWGFGSSRANTRTWNVNGNQWHKELNLEYDAPVTTAEKNLVFNYVNDVNHVETVDQISFTKYWVAQIWNGNTDQNADGVKAPVSHSYPNQTGAITDIIGGAQMDKLEILEKAGTWTHCNNFNHADNNDWIEPENGGVEGRTLMEESGTLSFRYTNSQSSYLSEKYIIVPGEKIHSSLAGFYYVCFDFERGYTDAEWDQEQTMGSYEAWNGHNYQGGFNFSLKGNLNEDQVKAAIGQVNGRDIQNIDIKGYLYGDKHCDGDDNYTDWIVRISPAEVKSSYDIRVIAEDLNANADDDARTDEDSDWDFNDVVFDIKFLDVPVDGKNVKIRVVAAGGTYPLYIEDQEVHALFDQDTDVMINTEAARYGKHYDTSTLPEIYLYSATAKETNGKDIHIYVDKGNGKIELTAEVGLPAAKLGVSPNFNFCKERVDITSQYPLFMQWVRTATPQAWWNSNITGN